MNQEISHIFKISKDLQKELNDFNKPAMVSPKSQNELVIDSILFSNSRGYLTNIVNQINRTYEYSCFDACSILIRKLIEILIIEIYEKEKKIAEIKDKNGNIFSLNELINKIENDSYLNIDKKTKKMLKNVKEKGDDSAHVRRYIANRKDLDKIIDNNLRVGIQDLIHLCGFDR